LIEIEWVRLTYGVYKYGMSIGFFGDTLSIGVANRQYREKCDIISLALHFGQGMAGRKDEI
jgi:hypothetical protein